MLKGKIAALHRTAVDQRPFVGTGILPERRDELIERKADVAAPAGWAGREVDGAGYALEVR